VGAFRNQLSAGVPVFFLISGVGLVLLVAIGGTASIALGAASYYAVERPFLALEDTKFRGRQPATLGS
jgi:peptidoglycan/LPS O-acetylase OafA/YrhL